MKYYRQFECDNLDDINVEILHHIKSRIDIYHPIIFWNPMPTVDFVRDTPKLQSWLRLNGLPIRSVAVTIGTNRDCCSVHVDTLPARYKLSWPVLNSSSTFNRFFEPKDSKLIIREQNVWGGYDYDLEQLREVDRMRVDRPALIDSQTPHDVWFEPKSQFPRLVLQCQLLKEPETL